MHKFSIKVKVTMIMAISIVASLLIAGVGIVRLGDLNGAIETITKKYVEKAFMAKDMEAVAIDLKNQDKTIILSDPSKLSDNNKRLDDLEDQIRMTLNDYQKTGVSTIEKQEIEAMRSNLDSWKTINRQVRELMTGGKLAEATTLVTTKSTEALNKLWENGEVLMKTQEQLVADEVKKADDLYKHSKLTLIIVSVSSILFALIISTLVTSKMAKDFTIITKKLEESSRRVAGAAEKISSSSSYLASTVAEQTGSVEVTSASLEEMSGMVENNVKNAENGLQDVGNVKNRAEQGNESMNNIKRSMEEILDSNKKIENLVKVIEEIGEKTAIIDEIVFQTKLLSFNASVEAERAGEHGRGFAVVAQEVGSLAQMSGKAALEISSIVKSSVKGAHEIAVENRTKAENGNKLVVDAAEVLQEIKKYSEDVLKGSVAIVSSSKEQSSGIKQINRAMESISKATQQTAITSEESAGAGEELSSQAKTMDNLVLQLSELVNGRGNVVRYNTNEAVDDVVDQEQEEVYSLAEARAARVATEVSQKASA